MGESFTSSPDILPPESCEVRGSAPGRVEFIGNHTDYNGGCVLGATIDRRVDVGLTPRNDRDLLLESSADVAPVRVSLDGFARQQGDGAWANYVLGVIAVLQEEGFVLPTGLNIAIDSTLPVGAGLSSSAALELATACALSELFDWPLERGELAQLSRRAENEFVGVPCGILDQAVVAFGDENRLVCINAQTEEIRTAPFPPKTQIWIFQTHDSHSLAETQYQDRYDESHAARDHLADLLGGVSHLVDVSPEQLEEVRDRLPDRLYRRARHVITEHHRVQRAVRLLKMGRLEAVGDLLFSSHRSSASDYENSTPELDFIVDCLAGKPSVLGARLTGAGFGGAAMAWTRNSFSWNQAEGIREAYANRFGESLEVLSCAPAPRCFSR